MSSYSGLSDHTKRMMEMAVEVHKYEIGRLRAALEVIRNGDYDNAHDCKKASRIAADALAGVAPETPRTQSEATYGGGIQVKDMDSHDVADAILRARPKPFMPATRLCVICDAPMPTTAPLTLCKCDACRNAP